MTKPKLKMTSPFINTLFFQSILVFFLLFTSHCGPIHSDTSGNSGSIEDTLTTSETIPVDGGTLTTSDQNLELTIEAGATTQNTNLTITALTSEQLLTLVPGLELNEDQNWDVGYQFTADGDLSLSSINASFNLGNDDSEDSENLTTTFAILAILQEEELTLLEDTTVELDEEDNQVYLKSALINSDNTEASTLISPQYQTKKTAKNFTLLVKKLKGFDAIIDSVPSELLVGEEFDVFADITGTQLDGNSEIKLTSGNYADTSLVPLKVITSATGNDPASRIFPNAFGSIDLQADPNFNTLGFSNNIFEDKSLGYKCETTGEGVFKALITAKGDVIENTVLGIISEKAFGPSSQTFQTKISKKIKCVTEITEFDDGEDDEKEEEKNTISIDDSSEIAFVFRENDCSLGTFDLGNRTITNLSNSEILIEIFVAPEGAINVSKETFTLAAGASQQINLNFSKCTELGSFEGKLTIEAVTTDETSTLQTIEIPIQTTKKGS